MRILYVTPLWSGLKDLIIDGEVEPKGMPAFNQPLRKLIHEGHEIDLIISTDSNIDKINTEGSFLKNSNIFFVPWNLKNINKFSLFHATYNFIIKKTKEKKYDFIYGHGSFGSLGVSVANKLHIPTGQRIYGTFLYNEINKSRFDLFRSHPLEYMAFKQRKSFLLVTNDGTKGDKVYERISKKRNFDFHFLLNGVEKVLSNYKQDEEDYSNYLIYPARIARWKQQEKAIKLIKILHDSGYYNFKLILAGHIAENEYWDEQKRYVENNNLQDVIEYRNVIEKEKLNILYKNAFAVLSFYDYSNLGNVVIEALQNGGIVISKNDGSLKGIIDSTKNGFLINDIFQAKELIINMAEGKYDLEEIRKNAVESGEENFMSWDERAQLEVNLIKKAVKEY